MANVYKVQNSRLVAKDVVVVDVVVPEGVGNGPHSCLFALVLSIVNRRALNKLKMASEIKLEKVNPTIKLCIPDNLCVCYILCVRIPRR